MIQTNARRYPCRARALRAFLLVAAVLFTCCLCHGDATRSLLWTAERTNATAGAPLPPPLAFVAQPHDTTVGAQQPLCVVAQDGQGEINRYFAGVVTLSIKSGPAGAALGGTTTVTAQGGVAALAFSVSQPGAYALTATSGAFSVDSAGFTASPVPALSIGDVAVTEGNDGSSDAQLTVTLSPPGGDTVTVSYATANGTAAAGSDYTAASGALTFAPGETSQTIGVPVAGDTLNETDETFTVVLSAAASVVIEDAQATGTITNDDALPELSVNDVTVTEGNGGVAGATFTVSLSAASGQVVTADWATADGTATAGSDYAASGATLTFQPGETSKTLAVPVVGERTYEPDETFLVDLSSAANASLSRARGTGTITNDDALPSLSITDCTGDEGTGAMTPLLFTVTLSIPSASEVRVDFAGAGGTAAQDVDFLSPAGTLLFAPGETEKTVTAMVLGDATDEADEQFTVTLSNPVDATLARARAVGTIQDDDSPPSLSIGGVTQAEGNAGATAFPFTVTLSAPSGKPITADWVTLATTATPNTDFAAASDRLYIAPGQTTASLSVAVLGDVTFEPDEQFYVSLSNAANATVAGGPGTATITNDDAPPLVRVSDIVVREAAGAAVFTVTLTGATQETATVSYATADGDARAGGDYTAASGTLTFAPGETSKTVSVPVTNDTTDEPDEAFLLNLTGTTFAFVGDAQGVCIVTDDDSAPSLSVGDVSREEGNAGTTDFAFTVALSAPSGKRVTVDWATANGSARDDSDFTAGSGTLTFAPGETEKTATVAVTGDALNEPDEAFSVVLSNSTSSPIARTRATGTILNDDALPELSVNDVTVTEGSGGAVSMAFAVILSAPSAQRVTVGCTTADDTATAGSDYLAVSRTLSFAPGEIAKTVTVYALSDRVHEPDEAFFVRLAGPVNAALADAEGIGTIVNDDAAPALSIADVMADEGDAGTTPFRFTVTISPPSVQEVRVEYACAGGSAAADTDFQPVQGTLVFAPGERSKTIEVPVIGDVANEVDERFLVTLSNPVNATLSRARAGGCIVDDDEPPVLSVSDVAQAEGEAGLTAFAFTVSLTQASGKTVVVEYATQDGTATAGSDYAATSGTLRFAPGQTSRTVTVLANGDRLWEYDETCILVLSEPANASIAPGGGTGTITNDDSLPTISFAAAASRSTGESGAVAITARLSKTHPLDVTAPFTVHGTATNPADYTISAGPLRIPAGQTEAAITVTLNQDALSEGDESVVVTLDTPANATLGAYPTHTLTIGDDDPLPAVAFTTNAQSGVEGSAFTATVTLSAPSGRSVTVPFAVSGTAESPADYTVTASPLVIPAGETMAAITVTILDDADDDTGETIVVGLGLPTNARLGTTPTHTITVMAGALAHLIFTQQPTNMAAGDAFTVAVRGVDAGGNTVTGDSSPVALAIHSGPDGAIMSGETKRNLKAGIAEFPFLHLYKPGDYTLTATAGDVGATSDRFTVNVGAPRYLFFTVQPRTTPLGLPIAPAVKVMVLDAWHNVCTGVTDPVVLSLETCPKGATLSGTLSAVPAAGAATFADLSIDKAFSGYTLRASLGSAVGISDPFAITQPAVAFTTEAQFGVEGRTLSAIVTLSEPAEVAVTVPFALSGTAENPADYAVYPASPLVIPAGETSALISVAILDDADDDAGETIVLTLGAPTNARLDPTATHTITVMAGALARLAFTQQAADVAAGAAFTVAVRGMDDHGNTVAGGEPFAVTLAIQSGPAGAVLSGETSRMTWTGIAEFPFLRLYKPGDYTLTATAGDVSATSSVFTVSAGAPTSLSFTVQPRTTPVGRPIAPAVQVTVLDAWGNVCAGEADPVVLSLETCPEGATLSGTLSVVPVAGVATFADLSIDKVFSGYTLRASLGSAVAASTSFAVTARVPIALRFTQQPSGAVVKATLTPPVKVAVVDCYGDVVTTASAFVSVRLYANPAGARLIGTTSVTTVGGVATFTMLAIDKPGTGLILRATKSLFPSTSLAGADSAPFTISAAAPASPAGRPDLLLWQEDAFAGEGVFLPAPAEPQVAALAVRAGQTATHQVALRNAGPTARAFFLKALLEAPAGWSVVCKAGEEDVTARLAAGCATKVLAPGEALILTVEMTPAADAPTGAQCVLTLPVFLGPADKTLRDAVQVAAAVQ